MGQGLANGIQFITEGIASRHNVVQLAYEKRLGHAWASSGTCLFRLETKRQAMFVLVICDLQEDVAGASQLW